MNPPPHETALVGVAMHDPAILDEELVTEADFASPHLGALWDLMVRLHRDRHPVGPAALAGQLHRLDIKGIEATDITDWWGAAPVPSLAEHYASLVAEHGTRARLAKVRIQIDDVLGADVPAAEAVEIIRGHIDAVSARTTAGLGLMVDTLADTITALESPTPPAVPSPWTDLNDIIGGWRAGAMYVVGARPGVGKSLLALGAALKLAETGGVAWASLEMPRQEVHERALAATAMVPLGRIKDHHLDEQDWVKIAEATTKLAGLPISIDDRAGVTAMDIRAHARTLHRKHPLAAVIVDYVQLMQAARGDRRDRHVVVGEFSRELKKLAMEMHVPVIVLSQLNRALEARSDRRPTMADLRESGALEQDSDVILLLHIEEEDETTLHVGVPKNRHGKQGAFTLLRRGHLSRLDNYAWTPTDAARRTA